MSQSKKIKIKQIASAIRKPKVQQECLHALGLKKINQVRELEDNPIVRGLIFKISHLVEVVSETK